MNKINVIIVEDHELYRLGIRTGIESRHPDIAIVGEAQTSAEFFGLLETVTADIVLLDIMLPDIRHRNCPSPEKRTPCNKNPCPIRRNRYGGSKETVECRY